uniref:Lipocalin/cytosolic fatty-acid binding domain-containing protein n=1 Tax=Bos mutus grunniens TaxID=30521 RepID=A0A8B9WJ66_BOSMU
MKLLLLCLGLTLVCAQEGNSDVVRSNFDIPKIAGEWYSILLASDNREKIEENGSMRVFVEYIDVLENSSLLFKFHTKVNGVCTELSLVSDSTGEDGVFTISYDGENKFRILQVNYSQHIIFYLENFSDSFQLLELYGRVLSCWCSSWGGETREGRKPGDRVDFPVVPWDLSPH